MFIGYVTNKKRWCGEDFKGMSRLYLKKYNLEKHYTYRSQCNKWIICFTVASNLDSIPEMDNEISSNYSLSKATNLLNKMLSNRQFEDILGIAKSTRMKLNNGVTLCCLRFCIASTLWTCRRQNQESSDKLITEQYTETEIIEKILEEDLSKLTNYFHVWRLQRYIMANKELRLHSRNCKQHTYIKYHRQAENQKQHSTENMWYLLLVFSFYFAENFAPVWLNSCHTKKVDVELNRTMRIIFDTLISTPSFRLLVLSHVSLPEISRKNFTLENIKR